MAGAESEKGSRRRRWSSEPFHNIIHRDCALGVRQVILGDGAAGMTLLAEVLNSGLKLLAHDHKLLHKTQAPVPQLHSVVVPVSVPLVSQ